jgi:plasmid maintenance system antidote protein VapI
MLHAMIDLFDPIYAGKLRLLRSNRWEKESVIAKELGLSQQDISHLLKGRMHFTDEIINQICRHYRISVSEFKKLETQKTSWLS